MFACVDYIIFQKINPTKKGLVKKIGGAQLLELINDRKGNNN